MNRSPPPSSSGPSLHENKPVTACPYCRGARVIRKGLRRNKYGDIQLFYCRHCRRKFTPLINKHRSFPLRVILDALTRYNRLFTLEETAAAVSEKYGIAVSRQNVRNWLTAFRDYLPFLRLRPEILKLYDRRKAIGEAQLLHGQVYTFRYHRAKADVIRERSAAPTRKAIAALQELCDSVPLYCPHGVFREQRPRASSHKGRFDIDGVIITPRQNAAVRSARFVLQAVANNKLRHDTLQEFMLANDSVTVAVEVPVLLDADDLTAFRARGYRIPLTLARGEIITGHIDIVQIRYGLIHILDYKPGARKVKPIEQLTIYALALSALTGIGLYHFKCAWFDDEEYFDFYPRTVVQKTTPRT